MAERWQGGDAVSTVVGMRCRTRIPCVPTSGAPSVGCGSTLSSVFEPTQPRRTNGGWWLLEAARPARGGADRGGGTRRDGTRRADQLFLRQNAPLTRRYIVRVSCRDAALCVCLNNTRSVGQQRAAFIRSRPGVAVGFSQLP